MKTKDVKLSQTSKMPCWSWSLKARDKCVVKCTYCYAARGHYLFSNVKNAQAYRDKDWKTNTWVSRMVNKLQEQTYFRWFDSGDLYCQELIDKVYQVCQQTPKIKHWIPTKTYFNKALDISKLEKLPNVTVRYSNYALDDYTSNPTKRIAVVASATHKGFTCPAREQGGSCLDCRECWNKKTRIINYPKH